MSMFTYNRDIPDGPNNPSNDQPKMKTNTNSTDNILAVDHVSFNKTPGGTHLQTTYSSKNAAGAQIDPQSVVYTGNGTASTVAQLFYRNQNAIFPASISRAFGTYAGAAVNGVIAPINQFNVVSVTRNGTGVYDVVLVADTTTSTSFAVLSTSTASSVLSQTGLVNYSVTGASTFTLSFFRNGTTAADPLGFSFMVLQI